MLWTAVVFFFLIGSAALAVDSSGAFGSARSDQNTADLACLAGVKELPNQTSAFNTAAAYVDANWDAMSSPTLTISGSTAVYADGSGNSVYMDGAYNGETDKMYLQITEQMDTAFAGAIGTSTITVTQEAACGGQSVQNGFGMLPMAALAGSWNASLFDCAAKVTGNCGAVSPFGGGGSSFRDGIGDGVDGNFLFHWGIESSFYNGIIRTNCSNSSDPCNAMKTETGNMVGPFRQGLGDRLDTAGINQSCPDADFNCDTLTEVLGQAPVALSSAPSGWQTDVHGPIADALDTSDGVFHYIYSGDTLVCDSPRLATIPIIAWSGNNKPLNWDLGSGPGTLPNGKKWVKIIGFYTIFIREPGTAAEITGSDAIVADILWFDGAECSDGTLFQPFGSTVALDTGVKLVAP